MIGALSAGVWLFYTLEHDPENPILWLFIANLLILVLIREKLY